MTTHGVTKDGLARKVLTTSQVSLRIDRQGDRERTIGISAASMTAGSSLVTWSSML